MCFISYIVFFSSKNYCLIFKRNINLSVNIFILVVYCFLYNTELFLCILFKFFWVSLKQLFWVWITCQVVIISLALLGQLQGNYCVFLVVLCLLWFSCSLMTYTDVFALGDTVTSVRFYRLILACKDLPPWRSSMKALVGYVTAVLAPVRVQLCTLCVALWVEVGVVTDCRNSQQLIQWMFAVMVRILGVSSDYDC